MANKTMHHAVIGDDTFELIDEAGREETASLKEDLNAVSDILFDEVSIDLTEETAISYNISPSTKKWAQGSQYSTYIVEIPSGSDILTIHSNEENVTPYAFLKTSAHALNTTPDYATGASRQTVDANTTVTLIVPEDAHYLWIPGTIQDVIYNPQSLVFDVPKTIPNVDRTLTKAGEAADAKTVGDKFNSYDIKSVNLYDKSNSANQTGVYLSKNTGKTAGGTSYGTSDYMDVTGIDALTTSYCTMLCFYDDTKTFVTGGGYQYSNYANRDYIATVPSGAKYARISYKLTDIDSVQAGYAVNRADYFAYDSKMSFDKLRIRSDQVIAVKPIVVAPSGGNYTSFTQAIWENCDKQCEILVKQGTYDIVQEYVDLFGQEVVDSLADDTDLNGFQYGIRLRYKKITFTSGAHLVCDWTGHTVNGTHRFSVFSIAEDVELDGLDLDCTALFYAIHDDYGSVTAPITKIYRNCRVIGHNIVNDNIIGGGCRPFAKYIIDNCYFDNNGLSTSICVRYHNSNVANSEPVLWITNSYFAQRLSFRYYGSQTTLMRAYVSGCHAVSIYKGAEGSATTDNVELVAWNNEMTA